MLHDIRPYEDQKMNQPIDLSDPEGAEKAVEIRFPKPYGFVRTRTGTDWLVVILNGYRMRFWLKRPEWCCV